MLSTDFTFVVSVFSVRVGVFVYCRKIFEGRKPVNFNIFVLFHFNIQIIIR